MIKRIPALVALAVVLAALLWAGHSLLFTTFMIYDDEGYVLLSLRNYGLHGGLYDHVFSQYGPAFFAIYDGLARLLHFTWDNTSARWVTLALWLGTAGFAAGAVWRMARDWVATLFTFTAVFVFLWVMIHEPSHPGGLVGFLVALGAWLGCRRDPANHPATAAALGAIGVCLLLTKVNVGVFFLTTAGGWLLAHAQAPALRRIAGPAVAAWCALMPLLLMQGLLEESWVRTYIVLGAASGLAAWLVVRRFAPPLAGTKTFAALIGAALAFGALVAGITLARGTTATGLLDGVLLEPLRHPRVYTFAFPWRPGALAAALLGLALVALASRRKAPRWIDPVILATRFVALAAFVGSATGLLPISLPAFGMTYGAAIAAVCAWPLAGTDASAPEARARRWLAWLLVFQFLHGYPVAGSQINWATFLLVPLLVLAAREAGSFSASRWRPERRRLLAWAATAGALAITALMTFKLCESAVWNRKTGELLGQPGAEKIMAADEIAFGLKAVALNARAHGDMLFSLPGAYSLNLWTGLPTPTLANATQWFNSLDARRQNDIVAALKAAQKPVLVIQQDVLKLLVKQGHSSDGPLSRYLSEAFAPVFSLDGYAFWARRGRRLAPLDTARWVQADAGENALEIILPGLSAPIARLDLWDVRPEGRKLVASLDPASARLEIQAIDEAGAPQSTALPAGWNAPAGGHTFCKVNIQWTGERPATYRLLLCPVDAAGRRLAAVRVLP